MQYPNSLVARLYKARYFANSSLLEATKGGSPSFIWSSLIETQDVIRRHARWRVGNGNKIRIYYDDWLPDSINRRISTFPYPFMENATVSSLLNDQGERWDEDSIVNIFNERDANLILSIPIAKTKREDELFWPEEDNGKFSVKSCYRVLSTVPRNITEEKWTSMWNLWLPAKIKNFFWQACTQCLPTADRLIAKKVNCSKVCLLCNKADESTLHAFVECDKAKACWNRIGSSLSSVGHTSFSEWIHNVFTVLDKENQSIIIVICWKLWFARNQKVWNNINIPPAIIVETARNYLKDWKESTRAVCSTQESG
ncbi:uncharacterized protein LOC116016226 [Ipomoea triloba]|uniref:uncharacterized protein LOC116016226 n=1 Tax=Ipomoea triloba TaxID=35885 RepID=UPI00125E90A0|nr:uncharacterized protein LOC116016226 [Ipomoea triloba]